jgi:hypothetical protein
MERYLFGMSDNERADIRKNAQKSVPLPWETVMTEVEERYRALIHKGKPKRKSLLSQLIP